MDSTFVSKLLVAVGLSMALAAASAEASCGDRPGTPDNVRTKVWSDTEINFRFRNTTRWGQMCFDIDVTVGPQNSPGPGITGALCHVVAYQGLYSHDFRGLTPNTRYCFRVRARTEPGTEGCTSQIWSAWACATTNAAAPSAPPANVPGDTCISGFVWRGVTPNDHVCVTPQIRTQVQTDNRAAVDRRASTQGNMDCQFGKRCLQENVPCKPGFVWREAVPQDFVCVTPATRQQVQDDNSKAAQRRVDHVPAGPK
jgi:hypothetical protein